MFILALIQSIAQQLTRFVKMFKLVRLALIYYKIITKFINQLATITKMDKRVSRSDVKGRQCERQCNGLDETSAWRENGCTVTVFAETPADTRGLCLGLLRGS